MPGWLRRRLSKIKAAYVRRRGIASYLEWANAPGVIDGECCSKELFSSYIRVVHLETDRFCNRSCVYCANHKLPQRREHSVMPENLFDKCLAELKQISYCGFVEFNGFNEPLADMTLLLKRVAALKAALPECCLIINSNGDYLKQENLDQLAKSGIDHMMITLHLNENEFHLNPAERLEKFSAFQKRIPQCEFDYDSEMGVWQADYNGLQLIVRVSDFCLVGHNFAGCAGKPVKRNIPCFVPLIHCYVDYAGRVAFCCSTNLDAPSCAPLIVGSVSDASLFELFVSEKARGLRRNLLNGKNMPGCCAVCSAQMDYPAKKIYQQNPYHPFFASHCSR